jgi:hypothetical protein
VCCVKCREFCTESTTTAASFGHHYHHSHHQQASSIRSIKRRSVGRSVVQVRSALQPSRRSKRQQSSKYAHAHTGKLAQSISHRPRSSAVLFSFLRHHRSSSKRSRHLSRFPRSGAHQTLFARHRLSRLITQRRSPMLVVVSSRCAAQLLRAIAMLALTRPPASQHSNATVIQRSRIQTRPRPRAFITAIVCTFQRPQRRSSDRPPAPCLPHALAGSCDIVHSTRAT